MPYQFNTISIPASVNTKTNSIQHVHVDIKSASNISIKYQYQYNYHFEQTFTIILANNLHCTKHNGFIMLMMPHSLPAPTHRKEKMRPNIRITMALHLGKDGYFAPEIGQ